MVEVSGDESEGDCLWEVSDCVLAFCPDLFSLVDLVCELDFLSVSGVQLDVPQNLAVSRKQA